jgi:hypothetical protein
MTNQKSTLLRIALLVVYVILAVPLAWVTDGHGLRLSLLGSWGFVSGMLVQSGVALVLPSVDFGLGERWLFVVIYSSTFVLYMFGLMKLNDRLRRRFRFPFPAIQFAVHSLGSLLCWGVIVNAYGEDSGPSFWYWLSIVLVTVYFLLEWQLALRSRGRTLQKEPVGISQE